MARARGWWAALALAPAILLADGAASADPLPAEGLQLPHGIHRGRNGRYYQDMCDHAYAFPCLAKRLLPETYRPWTFGPAGGNAGPSGSYCACGGGNPCGGQGPANPPPGGMTPTNVRDGYSIPASTSAGGKIVALIDMPDSTAFGDVNVYRKAFGIPQLPQCSDDNDAGVPDPAGGTPCFAAVGEEGTPNPTVTDCPSSDGETGLDMDMVSAACPDCSILLVQMTSADPDQGPSEIDFIDAVETAERLGAKAVSISFGGEEYKGDPTGMDYTKAGHVVLAAAGDTGYLDDTAGGTPEYPASAPDVLGVGGTTLKQSGNTYSEVVWDDGALGGAGGSGCSILWPMPGFQTTFLASNPDAFGNCTMRAVVDVSAAAEFDPGNFGGAIAEYDSTDGWEASVGTSAATPLVGSILTRLGLTDLVSANLGWIYTNISAFNDITSGTNDLMGTCSSVMCKAGPGWDGPTGVGTPNGAKLWALVAPTNGPDGGEEDGGDVDGGDAGPPQKNNESSTSSKSGCGCRTTPSPALDGLSLLSVAGLVGLTLRRRRRR
jgi:MYXO-CTERM domain-containing protein